MSVATFAYASSNNALLGEYTRLTCCMFCFECCSRSGWPDTMMRSMTRQVILELWRNSTRHDDNFVSAAPTVIDRCCFTVGLLVLQHVMMDFKQCFWCVIKIKFHDINWIFQPHRNPHRYIKWKTTFISTASWSKRLQNLNISRVHYLASLRLSRYLLIMITPSSRCKLGWARARSHTSHTHFVFLWVKKLPLSQLLWDYYSIHFSNDILHKSSRCRLWETMKAKRRKAISFSPPETALSCCRRRPTAIYLHTLYTIFTPFSSTQFIQIKS